MRTIARLMFAFLVAFSIPALARGQDETGSGIVEEAPAPMETESVESAESAELAGPVEPIEEPSGEDTSLDERTALEGASTIDDDASSDESGLGEDAVDSVDSDDAGNSSARGPFFLTGVNSGEGEGEDDGGTASGPASSVGPLGLQIAQAGEAPAPSTNPFSIPTSADFLPGAATLSANPPGGGLPTAGLLTTPFASGMPRSAIALEQQLRFGGGEPLRLSRVGAADFLNNATRPFPNMPRITPDQIVKIGPNGTGLPEIKAQIPGQMVPKGTGGQPTDGDLFVRSHGPGKFNTGSQWETQVQSNNKGSFRMDPLTGRWENMHQLGERAGSADPLTSRQGNETLARIHQRTAPPTGRVARVGSTLRANSGAIGTAVGLSALNGAATALGNVAWDVAMRDVTSETTDPEVALHQLTYLENRFNEPKGPMFALGALFTGTIDDEMRREDEGNAELRKLRTYWENQRVQRLLPDPSFNMYQNIPGFRRASP